MPLPHHVQRGELPGHPAVPDERAGAVRAGHGGQRQAEDPQGRRLLRGARRHPVLPAAAARPAALRRAGGGAAGRAPRPPHPRRAPRARRRAPHPAADLAGALAEVLVER